MSKPANPFRYFHPSPEVIRMVVMLYVRFPLSLRKVDDLLFERGCDLCHETVRLWWNRFGPLFAADIRRQRVSWMRSFGHCRWHLNEMHIELNGEMVYPGCLNPRRKPQQLSSLSAASRDRANRAGHDAALGTIPP